MFFEGNVPNKVVLNHSDHGMGNVLLFLGEVGVDVLAEALRQLLDDDRAVCDLLSVDLHERKLPLLRPQLRLMVHILKSSVSVRQ